MGLHIVSIDNGGSIRVAADGPITSACFASAADNPLQTLLGDEWSKHRILLDLDKAEYLDSAAVGWLITCHRSLMAEGGSLILHSLQPKAQRILRTLRIDAILPMAEDELAARTAKLKEAA